MPQLPDLSHTRAASGPLAARRALGCWNRALGCRNWTQRRWRFELAVLQLVLVCRYASSRCFWQAPLRERRPDWRRRSILNAPASLLEQHSPILKRAKPRKALFALQHCSITPSTRHSVKDGPAAGQTSGPQHILIRIQRVGPVRPPASLSTSSLHTPSRRRRDRTRLDVRAGIRRRRSDPPRSWKQI